MRKSMEPKVIKEEVVEKEPSTNYAENSGRTTRTSRVPSKDRCKTPDSPEGARLGQAPPASPPARSSPAALVRAASPLNGSADSLTPPPPPPSSSTSSATAALSADQHQHQQYATRPLAKVKRFLSTLVQFGGDIGTDVGDRVRSLVLSLVSSNLSIEEFHHSLQDVTNFPLRPFVLPFLRTHLPLLQREVHALARANKQSTLQYVRNHDHVILDPAHSPTELSEIFLPNDLQSSTGVKRKASESIYENGMNGQSQPDLSDYATPIKRQLTPQNNAFFLSHHGLLLPNSSATSAANPHYFDYTHPHPYPANPHRTEDAENCKARGDEEWRNIHVMLNCILSMVEKTKRALTILQQRNGQETTNEWLRKQDVSVDLKKAANEIMMHAVRQTEDRVAEVRRRAEDAVNDVKRQAVVELQKAVAAAEAKANDLVAAERAKMEKLLLDARKHVAEESNNGSSNADPGENTLSPGAASSQPAPSQQNSCWNCGRKAHETCSGCSVARYCGPFCQHKDWENHHQVCTKEKLRPLATSATPVAPPHVVQTEGVKFKK